MNMESSFPITTKTPNTPEFTDYGISIAIVKDELDQYICYGSFVTPLTKSDLSHKSLVLTINSNGRFKVIAPFKDTILFNEDIILTKNSKVGYFQLNIMTYLDITLPGEYHTICSIDKFLSNIEHFNIS